MLFMLRERRLDERMRDGQSWMESVTANGSSAKFPNVETVSECGSLALWAYSWWVTHHREALGESISPSQGVSASECGRGVGSCCSRFLPHTSLSLNDRLCARGARRRSCRSRFGARRERSSCKDSCEESEGVNGCGAAQRSRHSRSGRLLPVARHVRRTCTCTEGH